jgi:hypothetical protein
MSICINIDHIHVHKNVYISYTLLRTVLFSEHIPKAAMSKSCMGPLFYVKAHSFQRESAQKRPSWLPLDTLPKSSNMFA